MFGIFGNREQTEAINRIGTEIHRQLNEALASYEELTSERLSSAFTPGYLVGFVKAGFVALKCNDKSLPSKHMRQICDGVLPDKLYSIFQHQLAACGLRRDLGQDSYEELYNKGAESGIHDADFFRNSNSNSRNPVGLLNYLINSELDNGGVLSNVDDESSKRNEIYNNLADQIIGSALGYKSSVDTPNKAYSEYAGAEVVYLLLYALDRQALEKLSTSQRVDLIDDVSNLVMSGYVRANLGENAHQDVLSKNSSQMIKILNKRLSIYGKCKSFLDETGFPGKGTVLFAFSFFVRRALGMTKRYDVDDILIGIRDISDSDMDDFPLLPDILHDSIVMSSILDELKIADLVQINNDDFETPTALAGKEFEQDIPPSTEGEQERINHCWTLLNSKGYKIKESGSCWVVKEPLGGRQRISSLEELEQYAKSREYP